MTAIALEPEADTALIDRARTGDHDAFARIITTHEAMVFSLALHFFNDRARAEEIAQDVFLQLYRNLATIESDAHLLYWLRQVTSRRCIDVIRRSRMKAVSLDDAAPIATAPVGLDSDPLRDRRIRKYIAELPETQRTVVTLRYQEDLDPSEICTIVGMPVNTVKSHLHRALQSLRRRLGEH